MAISLAKGQRVSLDKSMTHALVGLGWDTNKYDGGQDFDLDAAAFLLGANGKVLSDEDFIFYNNLESKTGAVKHPGRFHQDARRSPKNRHHCHDPRSSCSPAEFWSGLQRLRACCQNGQ